MTFMAILNPIPKSKPCLPIIALLALCPLLPGTVQARTSDRNQPIEVSAQKADALAKPNGVSHLDGDVVITQGTLEAKAAHGTVHFDEQSEVDHIVLTGSPAHIKQLDNNGNLINGHANKIDYDVPHGIATLTGNAYIKQVSRGSARGDTLVYNTITSTMTAQSHGDNRVHMTFKPQHPSTSSSKK